MTAALSVTGLRSGYGRVPVLMDVDVTVERGEVVGMLGANGAGKSTLLRTLAGLVPASSGTMHVAGRDITTAKPWQRVRAGVVHVPEGRHIFAGMTVDENLDVAALTARSRRTEMLELVFEMFPRLAERRKQLATSLSGGEQQMLAIARALMCDPGVLLVDEMSAGLAPVVAQRLVEALVRAAAEGRAVLLVEQSPHLIADAVSRVYVLQQGRVTAQGSLDELGGAGAIGDVYLGMA